MLKVWSQKLLYAKRKVNYSHELSSGFVMRHQRCQYIGPYEYVLKFACLLYEGHFKKCVCGLGICSYNACGISEHVSGYASVRVCLVQG